MADVNYILKIDGVDGESQVTGYEGQIDVESFSNGVTNSGSWADTMGGGTGRSTFQDLNFTANICKAYPVLMLKCATGDHIPTAVLTCLKAGGGQQVYLTVTLTDVLVSSCQLGGSAGGDILPVIQFSLNFGQIDVVYQPQDKTGPTGNPVTVGYNLETAAKK